MNNASPPAPPYLYGGDYFAMVRAIVTLIALLCLVLPVPYQCKKELHGVCLGCMHGGGAPWTSESCRSFLEVVGERPAEAAWFCVPPLVLALAAWERYEVRRRRRLGTFPTRAGAARRLVFYVFAMLGLTVATFQLDIFGTRSDGLAAGVLDLCAALGLVAVVADLIVVTRERTRFAAPPRAVLLP